MRNKSILITAITLAVAGTGLLFSVNSRGAASPTLVVYKTPTCGCCGKWVDHMKAAGFKVEVNDMENLSGVKQRYGVTSKISSCHTAIVDGYVVEGHVPAEQVVRMLAERPQVKGITVPGMPMGSPGMEGPNAKPYQVYTFDDGGKTEVYATVTP